MMLAEMVKKEPRPCARCGGLRYVGKTAWCGECVAAVEEEGLQRRLQLVSWLAGEMDKPFSQPAPSPEAPGRRAPPMLCRFRTISRA